MMHTLSHWRETTVQLESPFDDPSRMGAGMLEDQAPRVPEPPRPIIPGRTSTRTPFLHPRLYICRKARFPFICRTTLSNSGAYTGINVGTSVRLAQQTPPLVKQGLHLRALLLCTHQELTRHFRLSFNLSRVALIFHEDHGSLAAQVHLLIFIQARAARVHRAHDVLLLCCPRDPVLLLLDHELDLPHLLVDRRHRRLDRSADIVLLTAPLDQPHRLAESEGPNGLLGVLGLLRRAHQYDSPGGSSERWLEQLSEH
mmetsp:Transcript_25100/g.44618  ORF Transcript_25100/g.44618 Transcript_25100/m.44618 type:complete len:256 (-) Transcript_25100:133-900(-)